MRQRNDDAVSCSSPLSTAVLYHNATETKCVISIVFLLLLRTMNVHNGYHRNYKIARHGQHTFFLKYQELKIYTTFKALFKNPKHEYVLSQQTPKTISVDLPCRIHRRSLAHQHLKIAKRQKQLHCTVFVNVESTNSLLCSDMETGHSSRSVSRCVTWGKG